MAALSIRLLNTADVAQALELCAEAGWNQTAEDWRMMLDLAPNCCFGIDADGKLAATATLFCYGAELAWLGMVLTRMEFRRRGLARLLVEHAIEVADRCGIRTIKLDATHLGQPLYESSGFLTEQEIERWSGFGSGSLPWSDPLPTNWTASTIAEKRLLFAALAQRGRFFGNEKEFAMQRSGSRATYLGPCVAHSAERAQQLISAALTSKIGPWCWDLLPANHQAVALARHFGFHCDRTLMRMRRGPANQEDQQSVFAIAGFEFG